MSFCFCGSQRFKRRKSVAFRIFSQIAGFKQVSNGSIGPPMNMRMTDAPITFAIRIVGEIMTMPMNMVMIALVTMAVFLRAVMFVVVMAMPVRMVMIALVTMASLLRTVKFRVVVMAMSVRMPWRTVMTMSVGMAATMFMYINRQIDAGSPKRRLFSNS